MENFIEINGLTKKFGKRKVVNDVTFNVNKGEIVGIIGNNGAGKTTLLRLLLDYLEPSSGEVKFAKIKYADKYGVIRERKPEKAAIIERPGYFGDLSAYSNLKAKALCMGKRIRKIQIHALLELVGLDNVGHKPVQRFSMGMKQRLGLALALLGDPDILILDEPINGLDPQGILEIRNLLLKIHEERNVTMFISSHLLDELARMATSFCVMKDGSVVKYCSKEQFIEECGEKTMDEYYVELVGGIIPSRKKAKMLAKEKARAERLAEKEAKKQAKEALPENVAKTKKSNEKERAKMEKMRAKAIKKGLTVVPVDEAVQPESVPNTDTIPSEGVTENVSSNYHRGELEGNTKGTDIDQ